MKYAKKLNAIVARWQGALSLADWDITARAVHSYTQDSLAHCEIDEYHKKARISIVRADERNESDLVYRTDEFLVLHEIIHIRFAPDGQHPVSPEALAMEQGINALTELLIELTAKETE